MWPACATLKRQLNAEREATVLFADIAGFTGMTERLGAARTVEILNVYFDEVTRLIGAHNGIVTQFQGHGVLATFNVPIEDPDHARNAFRAAEEILACVACRDFAGTRPGAHRPRHRPPGRGQCRRWRTPELHSPWRRPPEADLQPVDEIAVTRSRRAC